MHSALHDSFLCICCCCYCPFAISYFVCSSRLRADDEGTAGRLSFHHRFNVDEIAGAHIQTRSPRRASARVSAAERRPHTPHTHTRSHHSGWRAYSFGVALGPKKSHIFPKFMSFIFFFSISFSRCTSFKRHNVPLPSRPLPSPLVAYALSSSPVAVPCVCVRARHVIVGCIGCC